MKKRALGLLLLVISTSILAPFAHANEPTSPGEASPAIGLPGRNSVNVKAYPLPMLFKVFAMDVDIGTFRTLTLGPTLASFSYSDQAQRTELTAGWLGLRVNYTFGRSRFTDSWFLGTTLAGAQVKLASTTTVGAEAVDVSATVKASLFGLVGGYQWFWPGGFNLSLGAGLNSFSLKDQVALEGTVVSTGQTATVQFRVPRAARGAIPWVELGLGWAF